jgi:hypothetical protein
VSKVLAQHWPHFGFLVIGVVVFLWMAYRPEDSDSSARVEEPPRPDPTPASVRRSVARRGLLALGPLLGAVATGAVLYGLDVGGSPVPGAVIWVHAGISTLAALLVIYKLADLGPGRIRRGVTRQRLTELVSIALALVSVPLTVTGVALLLTPSTESFMAYAHLISSAWWTGLIGWHLRRYLGPSLRAAFSGQARGGQARARGGRTAPRSAVVESGRRSDPQPSRPA